MKISEIRVMSNEELNDKVYLLKEELFHIRRKKAVGQVEDAVRSRFIKKDIAKILTVLRERELGIK